MSNFAAVTRKSALAASLALGLLPSIMAAEGLSKYRGYQFGTNLSIVLGQTGANPTDVKVIQKRPALIQELQWRPQVVRASTEPEPVKEVLFTFYDGELFRIAVDYDRYQTEGMTTDDMVAAISGTYGTAVKLTDPTDTAPGVYGDQGTVLARWQDSEFSFDLVRFPYAPSYQLVGLLKRLDAPYKAALFEGARLDEREAPQRELARAASESEAQRAKLEKARLSNKPKFRM